MCRFLCKYEILLLDVDSWNGYKKGLWLMCDSVQLEPQSTHISCFCTQALTCACLIWHPSFLWPSAASANMFCFCYVFWVYYKAPASVSLRNPLSQIAVIIQHCWIICCERELKYSLTFNGFFQGEGSFDVYWKAHCLCLDQQKQTICAKDVSVCLQSCVLSEEVPYSNCHQHKMKIAIREVVCLYKLIITLIIYSL